MPISRLALEKRVAGNDPAPSGAIELEGAVKDAAAGRPTADRNPLRIMRIHLIWPPFCPAENRGTCMKQ